MYTGRGLVEHTQLQFECLKTRRCLSQRSIRTAVVEHVLSPRALPAPTPTSGDLRASLSAKWSPDATGSAGIMSLLQAGQINATVVAISQGILFLLIGAWSTLPNGAQYAKL